MWSLISRHNTIFVSMESFLLEFLLTGYTPRSDIVKWFWEVMEEFTDEQKLRFLQVSKFQPSVHSTCLSVCLFVCLSVYLSVCLFICLFVYYLSVCLSLRLSVCLYICLFVMSLRLSVCLSVCSLL